MFKEGRILLIIGLLLIVALTGFGDELSVPDRTLSSHAFIAKHMDINLSGVPKAFRLMSPMDPMQFTTDLGCRLDTGAVDIAFCIDSTGSMGRTISGVRSNIGAFIAELNARGYDYRLGAVTFGDGTNIWDFGGAPGAQMTSNSATFQSWLSGVGASGGADDPETSWDAIHEAIISYDWRPEALHIIIMFTDAPFCALDHLIGSGCCCNSATGVFSSGPPTAPIHIMPNPYDEAMTGGFVVFVSAPYSDTAWSGAWFQKIALDTGGNHYSLSTSWATIFSDVSALIATYTSINVTITNVSGTTIDPVNAMLLPENPSCVSVLSMNPVNSGGPVPNGSDVSFGWHVDVDSTCSGTDRCFYIRVWGGRYEDTLYGCTTDDSCKCIGPEVSVISPLPCGVVTACEYQQIQWEITDDDPGVDPSTIQIQVNGVTYNYPDYMTYIGNILTFTPTTPWTHGAYVDFRVTAANDYDGCPLLWSPPCNFYVDLHPPDLISISPACSTLLADTFYIGQWSITDDIAGIDILGSYFTVNGTPFYAGDPHLSFVGGSSIGTFTLQGSFGELGFYDYDTVTVCLHTQDLVSTTFCGPNDTVYCCTYYLNNPPYTYIIHPMPDSITACDPDSIVMVIADPDGNIDPYSIIFEVDGVRFTITSPELTYTDSFLVFHAPPDFWSDGDTVHPCLDYVTDIWGASLDSLPLCWEFIVDYEPPIARPHMYYPPPGTTMVVTPDTAWICFNDDVSGLDTGPITATVDGTPWTFTGVWRSDPLYGDSVYCVGLPLSIDICAGAGEFCTIDMCVDNIMDMPDYCDPNDTSYCWNFIVHRSGPIPEIIFPMPLTYDACDNSTITILIRPTLSDVDDASIILTVNGDTFTTADAELSFTDSILVFRPGTSWWEDGDTVYVSLDSVSDIYGTPAPTLPLEWTFYTDFSPPVFWSPFPPPGVVLATASPTISVYMWDSISGIDPASIHLTIGDSLTFDLSSACVTYNTSTGYFELLTDCAGIAFEDSDVVHICAYADDMPTYCGPNDSEYCWTFYVHLMGPVADIITPLNGQITSCADQCILIHLYDDWEGVNDTTIVLVINRSDTFTTSSSMLTYTPDDSLLQFCPDIDDWRLWANEETVYVELVAADDSLGNPLITPLSWFFAVDLEPPVFSGITPAAGETLRTLYPHIELDISDNLSGVADSSVRLTVGGIPYTPDSASLSWDGSHIIFNSPIRYEGGDSVRICAYACDSPDLCPPNTNDTCWVIIIAPGGPSPTIVRPFNGTFSSCYDERIIFQVADDDGIFLEPDSLRFTVLRSSDGITRTYNLDSTDVTYSYHLSGHYCEVTYLPSAPFADPETVTVCIVAAYDSLYNPMDAIPFCWEFYMDQTPPVLWDEEPDDGSIVATRTPIVGFHIADFISGLDSASLSISINGHLFYLGDPCVTVDYSDSSITVSTDCAGLMFSGGDAVTACVVAADSTDYCADNVLNYCWDFLIEPGGPEAEIVRPLPTDTSSCYLEYIAIHLWDSTGVVDSTIVMVVAGDTIRWGDSRLSYDHTTDMLYFVPDPVFDSLEYVCVELIAAADSLGNPLETPLDWCFWMDRVPPVISGLSPTDSTADPSPRISFSLWDTLAGINWDSLIVTVDGVPHTLLDPSLYEVGGVVYYDPDIDSIRWFGGDTICITVHAVDLADDYSDTTDWAGDPCPPNSSDTTWCFRIVTGGPVGVITHPYDSIYDACDPDSVVMSLTDDDGVLPESILVWINRPDAGIDAVIGLASGILEYDGVENLIYYPTPPFMDGEVVTIGIVAARDSLFNPIYSGDTITFIMDYSPPVVIGYTPTAGVSPDSVAPHICYDIYDSISGLDPSTITLTINDTLVYHIGDAGISWDGTSHLCFDPSAAGISWHGGDTVRVCIEMFDSPDLCEPHETDSCFEFYISPGGPTAVIVRAEPGVISACPGEVIHMTVEDPNGVVDTTIQLMVVRHAYTAAADTDTFTVADAELSYSEPMLLFYPDPLFEDGETLYACLLTAEDVLGNPLAEPVCWDFVMDLSPPVYWNATPAPGTQLAVRSEPISIQLNDSISGINPASIEVIFTNVTTGYSAIFHPETVGVHYDPTGQILNIFPDSLGILWSGGDSLCVSVSSFDSPTDTTDEDYCDPNASSYDWCFTVAPGGPQATIVRPLPLTFSSCPNERIEITLWDEDVGVNISTVILLINSDTVRWGNPGLFYDEGTHLLTYQPTPPFADGLLVQVVLLYAEDNLGNASSNMLDWSFVMDMTPPDYTLLAPPDTLTTTRDKHQDIIIQIHDGGSGIDPASIAFTVNDEAYTLSQLGWSYDTSAQMGTVRFVPENLGITFIGGDTICFHIESTDTTDYCDDNFSDSSRCFLVEPDVSCLEQPNPFTPNGDNVNDIAVFDYPYMFSQAGKLVIYNKRKEEVFRKDIPIVSSIYNYDVRSWDGRDNNGKPVPSGLYIYLLYDSTDQLICEGTVVVIR